jgi:hypothetical protein
VKTNFEILGETVVIKNMKAKNTLRVLFIFLLVCTVVSALSFIIRKDSVTEKKSVPVIRLSDSTTIREIATKYGFEYAP